MSVYEDIEDDVREKVKDRVVDGIEDGIKNSWDRIQDPGGWVSGSQPGPATFPGVREVAQASCRRWARGAGPQGPVADMTYRPVCGEYLDDIGELPGGGEFGPTFPGGQCPGVQYRAFAVRVRNNGNGPPGDAACQYFNDGEILIANSLTGPVTGFTTRTIPVGNQGVFAKEWTLNHAGSPVVIGAFFTGCPNAGFSGLRLERTDGQPDNCGNGKDGYQPTDYLPDDGGGKEPINTPGYPPFTIDIGPDGDIVVDFPGFDGPGRSIEDPYDQPDPDEYGPELPPPPPPGDRGEPDSPDNVEPGGDAEGEDPSRVLVGVKVTLTQIAPRARVSFLGGAPYYSYAYSVAMGGDGGVERDNDAAFAPSPAFYHAPENSNRYSVAFRNGFAGTVVPYWKEVSGD